MSLEYGIMTENISEKDLVKVIDKRLSDFFTGKAEYDIYKKHCLNKHKNSGGISFREDAVAWDYEYQYDYSNKPFGVFVELYPNTNDSGDQKFKIEGVTWNLFINQMLHYNNCKDKTPIEIIEFAEFILSEIPCKTVLIAEYGKGEERF